LEAYNRASRELAALHRERGDLVSAQVEARTSGYQQAVSEGGTVSDARHAADLASKHLATEIAKITGDIDGYEVELRYLDQLLVHLRSDDA
jgi:hypothetical protein